MTLTGTLLRILGAAILLIGVQFASVVAEAHGGHAHGPDGHGVQAHGLQSHAHGAAVGAVVGAARAISPDEAGSANRAAQAQPAAQAEAAVENGRVAPSSAGACVIGCCGTGMGCCGAALAAASPNLPPKAGSSRTGFARLISVREADPRGLRKPPRSLA